MPSEYSSTQSSPGETSFGSLDAQLVYDKLEPSAHKKVPSTSWSVRPIHTAVPPAAVTASAFSVASYTLARSPPCDWQSARANGHVFVCDMYVYWPGGGDGGGGEGEGGGGDGEGGGGDGDGAYGGIVTNPSVAYLDPMA